jgi:hypothetical protein
MANIVVALTHVPTEQYLQKECIERDAIFHKAVNWFSSIKSALFVLIFIKKVFLLSALFYFSSSDKII